MALATLLLIPLLMTMRTACAVGPPQMREAHGE
jgi:hypothetical protein